MADKIKLTFPDKSIKELDKGITPLVIAEMIGKKLAKDAIAAKVNGKLVDLNYPIKEDAEFAIVTFESKEGVEIFRHSTAHLLAYAIHELYPESKNTIGPAVEEGFYYDFDELNITPADFEKIEMKMKEIAQKAIPFKREELKQEDIGKLFPRNQYKQEMADEFIKAGEKLTAYQLGDGFVDLCRGPHVPNTSYIKAFKLIKVAGAYWRGDAKNKQLTRIYGISFPSEKQLKEHLAMLEEAEKRDHRKLGRELKLFMFHDLSPGSPFMLPKGTIVYNELLKFLREEYFKRGYKEVITPQMFNKALWEASGHWQHYKENMFLLKVDEEEFSLKPMNCPSHILIFNSETRSYRDLPLRIADFCMLHRNELRGVLGGMTRVRKFSQDDAHIFCTPDQIKSEIAGWLDFMNHIYRDVFNLKYTAKLSTKPDDAMGAPELWEKAEKSLAEALNSAGVKYVIKPKEGAFYGPKIDFDIKDSLGRDWQCATIQLDFNMPQRMKAEYIGQDDKKHTAVMIHRAILGSLERFIGVMVEHFAGRFPLWLSPEQVRVLSVSEKYGEYARNVVSQMQDKHIRAELDLRNESVPKKVREAELDKVNYIIVVGEKEVNENTVTVRTRNNVVRNAQKLDAFIAELLKEIAEKK